MSKSITRKQQKNLIRIVVDADTISDTQPVTPSADFDAIHTFKIQIFDFLWNNNTSLDYYKLVDEINASIYQASDNAAKMAEWRAWAKATRLALRYLDELVDLGHNTIGVNAMELIWNVRAFNAKIIPAWQEFNALRQGLKVEPQMVDVDESGQRFDDNYVPY